MYEMNKKNKTKQRTTLCDYVFWTLEIKIRSQYNTTNNNNLGKFYIEELYGREKTESFSSL